MRMDWLFAAIVIWGMSLVTFLVFYSLFFAKSV